MITGLPLAEFLLVWGPALIVFALCRWYGRWSEPGLKGMVRYAVYATAASALVWCVYFLAASTLMQLLVGEFSFRFMTVSVHLAAYLYYDMAWPVLAMIAAWSGGLLWGARRQKLEGRG